MPLGGVPRGEPHCFSRALASSRFLSITAGQEGRHRGGRSSRRPERQLCRWASSSRWHATTVCSRAPRLLFGVASLQRQKIITAAGRLLPALGLLTATPLSPTNCTEHPPFLLPPCCSHQPLLLPSHKCNSTPPLLLPTHISALSEPAPRTAATSQSTCHAPNRTQHSSPPAAAHPPALSQSAPRTAPVSCCPPTHQPHTTILPS